MRLIYGFNRPLHTTAYTSGFRNIQVFTVLEIRCSAAKLCQNPAAGVLEVAARRLPAMASETQYDAIMGELDELDLEEEVQGGEEVPPSSFYKLDVLTF